MVDIGRGDSSGAKASATLRPIGNAAEDEGRDDGVAWRAARIILTRLVAEPSYVELDAGLRVTIERFLERHPAMGPPGAWSDPTPMRRTARK